LFTESSSGLTFAIKQNGTGLLFLMAWQESAPCASVGCFGGIEIGHMNNTEPMGSTSTPTIMILVSPAFNGSVDEFISTGEFTPTPVEQDGYKTQTTCALNYANGQYTAECFRPFRLTDASPYDFNFPSETQCEIGFAVGLFSQPGNHLVSDMSTYVLSITNQTYSGSGSSTTASETSTTTTSGTETTSTGSSTTSTPSSPSGPSVLYYSVELAVIVVGFSLLVVLAMWRTGRK
jgi:hypothetical protein